MSFDLEFVNLVYKTDASVYYCSKMNETETTISNHNGAGARGSAVDPYGHLRPECANLKIAHNARVSEHDASDDAIRADVKSVKVKYDAAYWHPGIMGVYKSGDSVTVNVHLTVGVVHYDAVQTREHIVEEVAVARALQNDEGFSVSLDSLSYIDGKTYDGSGTWYCGRMLVTDRDVYPRVGWAVLT